MNSKRVIVLGSTGQLGTDLVKVLGANSETVVVPLNHADCDCADEIEVRRVIEDLHPDVVINCAAYVRVDDCEMHAREAFEVNAVGAVNVARACAAVEAVCVYISTDYVFDGGKETAYVESDQTGPINVYGTSKLAGEHLVRQTAPRWLIVRTASLFGTTGARGKGGNFVETILRKASTGERLKIVDDVQMSPTYTRDAAAAISHLIKQDTVGIVHVANAGACTWYAFALEALKLACVRASIDPVSSAEYPTRASRPKNSALQSQCFLVELRSWRNALSAYLTEKSSLLRYRRWPESANNT